MRKTLMTFGVALLVAGSASAAMLTYSANPGTNSSDFATGVAANGGTITTLDFEAHSLGSLNPNFYSGVSVVFDTEAVVTTALASQGGLTSPLSGGEGPGDASHHIYPSAAAYTMTITFDSPVLAAGFFVIDFYNPGGVNGNPFVAYDGPNGTGNILTSFTPEPYNFQLNNRYFMGALSTSADIRSIRFSSPGTAGDGVYIDNIEYATTATPEPGTWLMLASGGLLAWFRKRSAR